MTKYKSGFYEVDICPNINKDYVLLESLAALLSNHLMSVMFLALFLEVWFKFQEYLVMQAKDIVECKLFKLMKKIQYLKICYQFDKYHAWKCTREPFAEIGIYIM